MFTEISYHDFSINAIDKIKNDWFLITAGNQEHFNTMTASWGGLGNLWNECVAFVFVRPQRYTYQFTEENDTMTLSFYPKEYHQALSLLGTKSGRDSNKIQESRLTPMKFNDTMAFKEAEYVIVGKKLYIHDIKEENMLDDIVMKQYPQKDFHRMYIVKIEHIYQKMN